MKKTIEPPYKPASCLPACEQKSQSSGIIQEENEDETQKRDDKLPELDELKKTIEGAIKKIGAGPNYFKKKLPVDWDAEF